MRSASILLWLLAVTAPSLLSAQGADHADAPWTFRTRALLVGANAESDPPGLDAYSAFAIEADLSRHFGRHFAVELSLTSASLEVTSTVDGSESPVGSVELLPPTLMVQYHLLPDRRLHPYVGGGVALALFYEKSGALDSLDLATTFAPAAQLGADWDLSSRMLLNLDVKWLWLDTTLENQGAELATLTLDPFIVGLGLGFRF